MLYIMTNALLFQLDFHFPTVQYMIVALCLRQGFCAKKARREKAGKYIGNGNALGQKLKMLVPYNSKDEEW